MAVRGTLVAMMAAKPSVIAWSGLIGRAVLAALVWAAPCAAQSRHTALLLAPVKPACISSPFGPRVLPSQPLAGTYHYGVDLPAPDGAPILATAPGTVIRIQNKGPGGLEMLVQHNGFVGIYSHFGMITPAFSDGKRTVEAGETLGWVGNTGITTGAHVYFEMMSDGKPVDPAPYLGVPQCNGEIRPAPRATPVADAGVDGTTIGARKYYQILLPVRQ
jgi:murein DD-endopeptidase MepM/ murein hydrolase activator NlpD